MSFLFGETKTEAARPPEDIEGLREALAEFLEGQIGGLGPQDPKGFSLSPFFIEQFLDPTKELFTERRRGATAQGLESVGNLTGSGVAERIGSVVNRSLGQEQFLLSQILSGEFNRQFAGQESQRDRITRLLGGLSTAGVGAPQIFSQEGFLSSLFGGLSNASSFFDLISGGTQDPAGGFTGTFPGNTPQTPQLPGG